MPEDPDQMSFDETFDAIVDRLGHDWRAQLLRHLRGLIREAVPAVQEDIKWRKPSNPLGVPTWSSAGIICTGETYKAKVKLTFAQGASLEDPTGIFNSSLDGGTRRAVDFAEGDAVDADAFKALVRAAADHNGG